MTPKRLTERRHAHSPRLGSGVGTRLPRGAVVGDSRIGFHLSQLAGEFQARRSARAKHREGATRPSGICEIVRPLAARVAYGSTPIARADGPVSTVDFEPEMAVAPGGRFDTFDQHRAFGRCVGGENQATAPEGKVRDVVHWSPLLGRLRPRRCGELSALDGARTLSSGGSLHPRVRAGDVSVPKR